MTSIEWTMSDEGVLGKTWNPCVGCTKCSPGCKHCYAKTMHARLTAMGQAKYVQPFEAVRPWPPHLALPLTWKKGRRIFVNSMSDLFHEDMPDEYIAAVFGVMAACPQHTFQILTKRAERLPRWFEWVERDLRGRFKIPALLEHASVVVRDDADDVDAADRLCRLANDNAGRDMWPLPNVWLGVSVESQKYADERIPHLLNVPAAVRFLSCEPLLESIALSERALGMCNCMIPAQEGAGQHAVNCRVFKPRVDWVIVGGESGAGARAFALEWARSLVKQCRGEGIPIFVKQFGEKPFEVATKATGHWSHTLGSYVRSVDVAGKGGDMSEWPADLRVREFPTVRR